MSNFEKIQIRITEYKQILQFIFLIIKENFPFICIYLLLQLPLFIFGNYLSYIDFIFKCIAWQIWLGVFLVMIYTMKYNIRKQLQKELNLKIEDIKSNYPSLIKTEILED